MEKENRLLLYKDLCCRLPYNVVIFNTEPDDPSVGFNSFLSGEMLDKLKNDYDTNTYEFKPYLRSMDTMTEEEDHEYALLQVYDGIHEDKFMIPWDASNLLDYLNRKGFDYRGLIPKGLALEMPKELYV